MESSIEINNHAENYFFIDNIKNNLYSKYDIFYNLKINELFIFYFNCFFNKALISKINKLTKYEKIELNAEYILGFFKYCFYYKIQPTNIKNIELIITNILYICNFTKVF